jgi:PAS domain S-box-containing protein
MMGEKIDPRYQIQIICKDKSYKWIELNGVKIEWEGKAAIMDFVSDVSLIKNAEDTLRESENKFRTLFEAAPDAIFLADPETGIILDANNAASKLIKREKNELIGMHQSLLHPKELLVESKNEFYRLIQESLTNNLNYALEFAVINSEGNIIPVEILSQMIYQNEKQIVMGTFRDITERKRAKDELIKQKHFFEQMFMQSFVSTEILDKDGWCERINPKLSEIFGVDAYEMEGRKYNIFKDQSLIDAGIVEKLQKVFQNGETIEWELLFDIGKAADSQNIKINEKKQVWYHNWAYPIFDENKQLINVIIQHNNINERKFNEEIINLKNQELAELNAAKDKFFSIIAHDLKSPFSGFMGLSKMMSENINNFTLSELHDISKNIQESAKNLYTLLENLLEWSRMQRGSISFNPENCPLVFIIAQNISICEEVASQKNITISNLISTDLVIFADIPMLNTVIRNLLSNAIKFTPRGGKIEVGASIIAVNDNEIIEVYIKDNGIGIDSKLKNNLFKIDTKVSRQGTEGEPSTGLGLLLCKDFIEKNNGTLRVESTENVGSTFFFTLNSK